MFGDELDLGYHAYSILKTGRDYQGNFAPINFHSLAEWRTPLYLYSAVPSVFIFGISALGVRLPAAIFGVLGVWAIYLLCKKLFDSKNAGMIAAFLLAVSPWHIQYSRAGFEVTEMLFFLTIGVYFYLKSFDNSKYLWLSVLFLVTTAWVYSTAKLFTPFFILFLFVINHKDILKFPKNDLFKTLIVGAVVGLPLVYGIFFGGGSQRFNYISVFADPTTEPEIGSSRSIDSFARGETGLALKPKLIDRVIHNKFTYWSSQIITNYFKSFSTQFLFIKGDPNPRQSVGVGELYKIEILSLILGIVFFLTSKINGKLKILLLFWLTLSPLPAALTKDGGDHATRLILMLIPLTALSAYGWFSLYSNLSGVFKIIFVPVLIVAYIFSFFLYLHEYFVHYPYSSERWWHYGWGQALAEVKKIDSNYDKVIISMAGEPAWIFFAAYYQYDPVKWQNDYPIGKDVELKGFGNVSHINKYYFGSPQSDVQIYGLSKVIDGKTIYLANAKEVGENLIINPDKTPSGLRLIKAIPFLTGEPAFYLFDIKN